MTLTMQRPAEPRWSEPRVVGVSRAVARRRAAAVAVGVVLLAGTAVVVADEEEKPEVPVPVAPTGVASAEGLTPQLARAVRLAREAAAVEGVQLQITSGWRSAQRQAQLHAEAIEKYGSAAKARRWVLPPEESEHVTGRAVDVGPEAGIAWLREHGVRFGLCQRYANEPWHFERLAGAKGSACPPLEPHP